MLDEVLRGLSPHWAHSQESMASGEPIRTTQAVRLHCLEQFVRMLIQRHRFSDLVAERKLGEKEGEPTSTERDAMMACNACALQIIYAHRQIAIKGLMTYYGVHVIHQLNQAGRTLVAVLLNCTTEDLKPLIPNSLDALRVCVELLRKFSGRYLCGLRSGDLIEEFCRLTNIPLDTPPRNDKNRPPWIRPVRKKTPSRGTGGAGSGDSPHTDSPERSSPASGMGSEPDNMMFDYAQTGGSPPFASPPVPGIDSLPGGVSADSSTAQPFDLTYPPLSTGFGIDVFGLGNDGRASNGMMSSELMALMEEHEFGFGSTFDPLGVDGHHGRNGSSGLGPSGQ